MDHPDFVASFDRLSEDILEVNNSNGWDVTTPKCWDDCNKLATKIALIHSEASEALEAIRHGDADNFLEEMADIVIRVADMTAGLGFPLGDAILKKLDKNRSRGYRHGGKAI